ncbi:MAG TPA: NAD(P)/FAD-dependent oxidoreductase [Dehalococcoidia bacterium]|nr:NAD(P)/FAD-dependent oxidoreductase [Dehalococcoidia bacterium]
MSSKTSTSERPAGKGKPVEQYDVIIIGAGISGMYALHRLRGLGFSVRAFEAGAAVGGTWYWNRYPGARFDSESWTYGYSFDDEILQEWDWSEHFAGQPETLRYCNFVADKLDLRRDITFNTRIISATFEEAADKWEIQAGDGRRARAQFLVTAIGPLSALTMPNIPGVDSFQGEAYHTARWPHEPVTFEGKRVAVIGTGATGVQTITEVAKTAATLTVFQRTPNFCAPLHNSRIDAETQRKIKSTYPQIFARCKETWGAFIHQADERHAMDVTPEEREAFYEKLYAEPGFGIWMGNFRDLMVVPEANATITDFISRKIRERVHDPKTAEKLIPKNHGFGTRRVPLESGYYEVYNQDNVTLVDINETPIECITATGIKTSDAEYGFDMIIYATGFDAITGAFDRIDIRGIGGKALKDAWADGPATYLGLAVAGFPNFLTLIGPHNAATFCNIPRCAEQNVDWVAGLLAYMREHNYQRIVPAVEAQDAWTEHVYDTGRHLLLSQVDSWMTGVNKNVPGRLKRTFMAYAGGAPNYRQRCEEAAANGYEGFELK